MERGDILTLLLQGGCTYGELGDRGFWGEPCVDGVHPACSRSRRPGRSIGLPYFRTLSHRIVSFCLLSLLSSPQILVSSSSPPSLLLSSLLLSSPFLLCFCIIDLILKRYLKGKVMCESLLSSHTNVDSILETLFAKEFMWGFSDGN